MRGPSLKATAAASDGSEAAEPPHERRKEEREMSQRMTMADVLREYGRPIIRLDLHATRAELEELRSKLMAVRDLSGGKEQGYLDIDCKLYIDVDDIDRYLSGELDTVGEIYAFPEDVKSYREQ
jgi:hypothetical protein